MRKTNIHRLRDFQDSSKINSGFVGPFGQARGLRSEQQRVRNKLTQAVVSAAVCEFVFESSFPQFVDSESPLLDQYRKIVLIKVSAINPTHFVELVGLRIALPGGPETVSKIDLLAKNALIVQNYFQSVLLPTVA